MVIVKNPWNVNAFQDILAYFVKYQYVQRVATETEVTAEDQESADVKSGGGEKIATHVIPIQDVLMETAEDRGNATADLDGVECFAMKK